MPGSCKVTNLARHPRAPDLPDLELDLSSTRVLIYPLSVGPCRAVSPARRVAALALAPSALHIYPMWWCPPSFGALSLSSLSFPARSAFRAAALVRAGSWLPASCSMTSTSKKQKKTLKMPWVRPHKTRNFDREGVYSAADGRSRRSGTRSAAPRAASPGPPAARARSGRRS